MDKEQILEGNKLIAEFLHCEVYDDNVIHVQEPTPPWFRNQIISGLSKTEHLCFNSSSDSLMLLVKNIESLLAYSKIPNYYRGYDYWMKVFRSNFWDSSKLYDSIIEFIKWYNENK
jgi:hypothetical protein